MTKRAHKRPPPKRAPARRGKRKNPSTPKERADAVAAYSRAVDEYKKLHWGRGAKGELKTLEVADPHDVLVVLGEELVTVVYATRKGSDREMVEYEHTFQHPRPRLCIDRKGRLAIAGGRYKVVERGIVG